MTIVRQAGLSGLSTEVVCAGVHVRLITANQA